MENVKDLFHQFVDELKNEERKKAVVVAAEKFYGEIENSSEEIRDPVDLEEILRSSKTGKEKKRDLLLRFYRFYENKTGIAVESDLGMCSSFVIYRGNVLYSLLWVAMTLLYSSNTVTSRNDALMTAVFPWLW